MLIEIVAGFVPARIDEKPFRFGRPVQRAIGRSAFLVAPSGDALSNCAKIDDVSHAECSIRADDLVTDYLR